ncbi:MAG: hypothetical protein KatS3mg035_2001 [Bacteroidia bacterium]|nr:MAG: hypothetical protein KatS3mg035_2001 [Bacteroidia bacterium]
MKVPPVDYTVTVNPTPTVSVTPTYSEICYDDSVTLTASSVVGTTFEWNVLGNSTVVHTGANFTVLGSMANAYEVVAISPQGCRSTPALAIVSVLSAPEPFITTLDSILCIGESTTLNANGAATYRWTLVRDGVPFSTASSVTVTPSVTTTYYLYGVGANGCPNPEPDSIIVTVNNPPTFTGPNSVCAGSQGITYTSSTASDWTISGTNGSSIVGSTTNTNAITVNFGTPGTNTITLTDVLTGCDTVITVTVNPNPVISGSSEVCEYAMNEVYTSTIAGDWTITSGTGAVIASSPSDTNAVSINFGTFETVILQVTDSNGCIDTMHVIVNPKPIITGVNAICEGNTSDFTSTIVGNWNIISASGNTITTSTTNVSSVTVNFANPGTDTLIVRTATGCKDTIIVSINSNPVISGITAICAETPNQTFTSTIAGDWTITSAGGASFVGSTNNTNTVTVDFGSAETVTLQVTTADGCTDTHQITVNPNPEITGPVGLCVDEQGAVFTSSIVGDWTISGINASITSGATNTNSITVDAGNTVGSFTLKITDANGCQDSVTVNVTPKPIINAPAQVCAQTPSVSISSNVPGDWSISSTSGAVITSGSTNTDQITVTFGNAGTETITITNTLGCSQSFDITVLPLPTVNGANSVCEFTQNSIFTANENGTFNLVSSTGSTITTTNPDNISVNFGAAGTDTIFFTNVNGCIDTFTVVINPLPELIVTDGVACTNDVVTLNVSGNPTGGIFAFYTDANAVNPFFVGSSYTTTPVTQDTTIFVEYIANNCTSARLPVNVVHNVRPTINVTWTPNPAAYPGNNTVTFANNTINADTYQWNFGSQGTSNLTNPSVTYNAPGDYTVILTAINSQTGCISIDTFIVTAEVN